MREADRFRGAVGPPDRPLASNNEGAQATSAERGSPNIWSAAAIGFVVAAVLILLAARGDVDRMVRSDGLVYQYVASHLNEHPDEVIAGVVERGTSLRYGRIGFSALLWLSAAGRPQAMPYVQPILVALCAGLASAAAVRLLPGGGLLSAVIPFLAPGFSISVVGGYAEPLAVALCMWALVFIGRERWGWAIAAFSFALLTRENAAVVLVGAGLWLLFHKRVSRAALLGLSVVPVAIWYAYVRSRYGHVPIFDPYLNVATDAVGTPFAAIWESLTNAPARSTLLAGMHAAIAVFAFWQWRRGLIGAVAAASALQILSAGPFAWHFTAEAARVFTFLQLFAILALINLLGRMGREPVSRAAG